MLDLQVKQITIPENRNIHTYSLFCLVVLAVGNLRKPLLLVTYRNQAILHFHFSLKSRKENIIKKKNSNHFSLTWNEVKKWSLIQYLCTMHVHMICITMISRIMQNFYMVIQYRNFPIAFRKRNVSKIYTSSGTLAHQIEKLARHSARWQTKLKQWHGLSHVGTFIDVLTSKNKKLARFWDARTLACKIC